MDCSCGSVRNFYLGEKGGSLNDEEWFDPRKHSLAQFLFDVASCCREKFEEKCADQHLSFLSYYRYGLVHFKSI